MARDWIRIVGYFSLVQILLSTTEFILSFGSDISLGMTVGAGIASGAALGIAAGFEEEGKKESLILHAVMSGLFGVASFIPFGQAINDTEPLKKATLALLFITAIISLALTVMSAVLAWKFTPSQGTGEKKPLLSTINA